MMLTTCGYLLVACATLALTLFGLLVRGAWRSHRDARAARSPGQAAPGPMAAAAGAIAADR